METFINNLTSFPVVVFTFLLMLVILYWLLALVGIFDVDLFDADTDLNIDLDADAEGLNGLTGFMLNWGLTGVPVTVVISLLIATSWLLCYLVVSIIFPLIPWDIIRIVVGLLLLVVCFAISIPLTAYSIRPFKGMFVSHSAVRKATLVGRQCEVKTGEVNAQFGQGVLHDGEAGMILDIRSTEDIEINRGDIVILIEYNEADGSYFVAKSK